MSIRNKRFRAQLDTTATVLIYTVPDGSVAKVDKLTLSNTDTTQVSGANVFVGGTAAANKVFGPLAIPASEAITPSLANHTLEAGDSVHLQVGTAAQINYYLSVVQRTQGPGN